MKPKVTVLNQQEKQALKEEVLAELEKETLKKEIVAELQSTKGNFSFSNIIKHPAILLVIGFAMTGIVGTWLTSSWQQREWDRQQSRLVQIHRVDQKYAVIDETIKAVGENDSVVVEMFRYLTTSQYYKYPKQLDEYVIDYGSKRDNGRISFSIVKQKLLIYFRNLAIPALFQQLADKRWEMHKHLDSMLGKYENSKKQAEEHGYDFDMMFDHGELATEGNAITTTIDDTEDLKQLINLMTEEIRQDVEGLD